MPRLGNRFEIYFYIVSPDVENGLCDFLCECEERDKTIVPVTVVAPVEKRQVFVKQLLSCIE